MNLRDVIPTAENSSNFNVVPESITEVGTTLENLKAAVCGETGASAKYAACAAAAKEQGFDQIARLFEATSAAEQIHIGLEYALVAEDEAYYLCPVCGYIHKGDDFEKCPICFTPADKFRKF